jgi:hypothetical protein
MPTSGRVDPPEGTIFESSSWNKRSAFAVVISVLLQCEGRVSMSSGRLIFAARATDFVLRLHTDELKAEIKQPVEESVQL